MFCLESDDRCCLGLSVLCCLESDDRFSLGVSVLSDLHAVSSPTAVVVFSGCIVWCIDSDVRLGLYLSVLCAV